MYSTVPKEKTSQIFHLQAVCSQAQPYRAQSHWLIKMSVIGCSTEYCNSEKEPCSCGTAHARMRTLTDMHINTHKHTETHAHVQS